MKTNKYISIILVAFGMTVSMSSYADKNTDYMNIQNHWKMIMNEKNMGKRAPMIKRHRMMLDDFEKNFNKQNSMPGNQMGNMKENQMKGMPGNQMGNMQGEQMKGMPGNQMGDMQGNHMKGRPGNQMGGMQGNHMNMMNTINMHRSQMNMMGQ